MPRGLPEPPALIVCHKVASYSGTAARKTAFACDVICAPLVFSYESFKPCVTAHGHARRLPDELYGKHSAYFHMCTGYGNLDDQFSEYLRWVKWVVGAHVRQWFPVRRICSPLPGLSP